MTPACSSRRCLFGLPVLGCVLLALLLLGCGEEGASPESAAATVVPESEVQRKVEAARRRLTQNEGGRRVLRAIEERGG
mgnify:CR=1 FL=1